MNSGKKQKQELIKTYSTIFFGPINPSNFLFSNNGPKSAGYFIKGSEI